jgi:hypothetical protein
MRRMRFFAAALCAAALAGAPAMAAPAGGEKADEDTGLRLGLPGGVFTSEYTKLDLDQCEADPDSEAGYGRWRCKGLTADWPVHVTADDLRMTVSYGENGLNEAAAQQWFGPFNHIHDTLEWVLKREEGAEPKPAATILRFILEFLDGSGETPRKHPILVVTQLKPGAVCHIAYVDARANPKANMDARAAAARLAGSFDCAAEPELVGPQSPGVFAE